MKNVNYKIIQKYHITVKKLTKEPASPQPEKALAENSEPEENPVALPDSENAAGEVKVSVSPIQRPDCLAFGDVVFSDGSKAEWFLDRAGQLGLKQEDKSKPIPEGDIPVFQQKLQKGYLHGSPVRDSGYGERVRQFI